MWMDCVMWSEGGGWKHGKRQGRVWKGKRVGLSKDVMKKGDMDGRVVVYGRKGMDGTRWG